ncbi:histidine phosphatase family protein [Streptomyces sp. NPDC001793]|uniref:histidine phosphatase family protein n=1 Tax=Streptomyces sp. NPDC001793 TaxID=3154657 RepID=UPI003319F1E7
MKIALMRHGETEFNARRIFLSRTDAELNETGMRQAKSAAQRLSLGSWSAIYASPLARSQQVADVLSGELRLPVRLFDGLRERELGELEGLGIEDYAQSHPAEYARLINDPDYAPHRGETQHAVVDRVTECLKMMVRQSTSSAPGAALVVTHGAVLAILARHAGLPGDRLRAAVRNCHLLCLDAEFDTGQSLSLRLRHWDVAPDEAGAWASSASLETTVPSPSAEATWPRTNAQPRNSSC